MTKLCNSCEYLKFCARSGIETVGCDRYKKDTTTNEEWLRSCDTEHLAWMISLFVGNAIAKHDCGNDEDIKPIKWVEWLKQPHGGES